MYHVPRKGGTSLRAPTDRPRRETDTDTCWPQAHLQPGESILLRKCSAAGAPRLSYPGRIVDCDQGHIRILAHWTETAEYACFSMRRGDPVCEHFFRDRWYNVLTLWEGDTARFRGWYVDICRPPTLRPTDDGWMLQYEDLTLDLFIAPELRVVLLDEAEFRKEILPHLTADEIRACLEAVCEVAGLARRRRGPFAQVPNRARAARMSDRPDRSRPK